MPILVSRPRVVLLAIALLLAPALATVPPTASATPIVIDRFTDGSTGGSLNFSFHSWNDTLAIEVPRGADIEGAELTVTGVEGSSIADTRMDFSTDDIGPDLWALDAAGLDLYPPHVDPYKSGWNPIRPELVKRLMAEDGSWWLTDTDAMMQKPPWEWPLQMYHFHPDLPRATSFTVSWKGCGECDSNLSHICQAELWLYNHTGSAWERRADYDSDDTDDVWLNASIRSSDASVSSNGSIDVIIAGPHCDFDGEMFDWGWLWTDYIALDASVPGVMEYPENATLCVGGARMNLSAGPLKGPLKVGDALGLKDALQAIIDAEVVMPGTIVIPLNLSVAWRTLSRLDVGGLRVEYEPVVNAPPAWRGPAVVDILEDSEWTMVLDLEAAFSDDYNQGVLRFSLVSVSDPLNLSTRMQFGTTGNWTIMAKPSPDFFGEVMVTLNATDMFGEVTEAPPFTVRVVQVADRPSIVDPGELKATEGVRFQYTLQATDPDLPDDVLTWSDASDLLDVDPATGAIDWTPGKDQVGPHRFTVTVTDGFALQGIATVTIAVANTNDPPVITSQLTLTVDQDQTVEYDIVATDPDTPFGDVLSYYASSEDIEVQCGVSTGRVTFTPTNDDVGTLAVQVRVEDKATVKDERTLVVTVRNVNDPPVLQGPGPQMHDQGETVSVRLLASDPDLSVAGAGEHTALTHDGPDWLGPDAAGWINLVVGQANVGVWWVNYTLTDAAGLASKVLVVWTLTDVNDAPVISTVVPALVDAKEGERFVLWLQATDIDGDMLAWSDDSDLFVIGVSDGTITFTPIQPDVGTHRVTVTVSDGHQGQASIAFDLVVANVNDVPVIGGMSPLNGTSFKEGEPISFLASATDEDGDRLTFIWKEGGKELGRGSPFATSSLRPGKHTVTLVVDDGNATVERQLDVVVKEKEGGFGGMAIALIAVVVVAVLIVVVALAMRARKGAPPGESESASLAGPSASAGGEAATSPEAEEPPKIEIEHREV